MAILYARGLLALLVFCWMSAESVEIKEIIAPGVVQHNTNSSTLLDCIYELADDETDILIVKWFFQNERHLVYQWGAGLKPSDTGVLRGRLQLDHVASSSPLHRHRALLIRNPVVCLSGLYICKVSTNVNVVTASKRMIVYAPAESMILTYTKPTSVSVNVTCAVRQVFPAPNIQIYAKPRRKPDRILLEGMTTFSSTSEEGLLNVSVSKILHDHQIDSETLFECILVLPSTQYSLKRTTTYYSGAVLAASTSGCTRHAELAWLTFSIYIVSLTRIGGCLR